MSNPTRVVLAGLIASVVMGMIEMVYEAIGGAGFWSPVVFIAATLLRHLQTVAVPVPFDAMAVVLGLMGHMMNSVILGVLFTTVIAPRLHGAVALLAGGAAYGLAVFVMMWLLVVPLADPVMLQLNAPVFAVAHLMWGAVLGLILGTESERARLAARPAH